MFRIKKPTLKELGNRGFVRATRKIGQAKNRFLLIHRMEKYRPLMSAFTKEEIHREFFK